MLPRPLPNEVAHSSRYLCMTQIGLETATQVLDHVMVIEDARQQLHPLHPLSRALLAYEAHCVEGIWPELVYGANEVLPRAPRNSIPKYFDSIERALERVGMRHFRHFFLFSPEEMNLVIDKIFDGQETLDLGRRGSNVAVVEAMLLFMCRTRNATSSLVSESVLSGRDPAFISAATHVIADYIVEFHGHRLALANIDRYASSFDAWNQAFFAKYCETVDDAVELPARWKGINLVVDGLRFRICRPQENESIWYSNYVHYHNQMILAFVCPAGMYRGITYGHAGSANDPGVAIVDNVTSILGPQGVILLGDSIFGLDEVFRPMLKTNNPAFNSYPKVVRRAMASCRIIVEHAFGETQQSFPYLNYYLKQKVYATSPFTFVQACCLMHNVVVLLRGAPATTYMHVLPESLDEYFD
jgi:hypothetical protein